MVVVWIVFCFDFSYTWGIPVFFVIKSEDGLNKEYFYIKGYTIEQSHGGADVSHERRSIFVKDEDTGKVFEITVFSEYIDENDFLEVEFLPHTKYGAIISREKSRWLG